MKNRIISLVMVLALVFTLLPVYAIADNTADTAPEVDQGMTVGEKVDIKTLIDKVKALLESDDLDGLMDVLPKLDSDTFQDILDELSIKDSQALLDMLKSLLNKEDGSINSDVLSELLKLFVGDDELDGFFSGGISAEQLQALLEKYLKDGSLDGLKDLIPEGSLQELLDKLMGGKNFEDLFGGIDTDKLLEALKGLLGDANIDDLLNGLDSETLQKLLEKFDAGQLQELLDKLMNGGFDIDELIGKLDSEALQKLLEKFDVGQLQELLDKLMNGGFDIDELIGKLDSEALQKLLEKFDVGQLQELLDKLMNGGFDIDELIGKLDSEALQKLLEKFDLQQLQDILDKLLDGNFNIDDLLDNLDSETLQKLLDKLDAGQLKDIIDKLLGGDTDIGDLLDNLSMDKLIELFKQLMGDNDTLNKLFEKLDSDKIGEIIQKLLDGDFDINGLFKNLDAYSILKAIAGLIGSDLDVTGPNDVTVDEGSSATFSVKVKTAGTYKYMWLEPDSVKNIDLSGVDLSGSKLELGMKLLQIIKQLPNLSRTDSYTIEKTTADDNGRTFACMIYNVSVSDLKNAVVYVTDEATLTVNPAAPHEHTKVIDTPAVKATCTEPGSTEGSHCSECGEVLSKAEVIPATGHNYEFKVCAVCGYEITFPFTDVKKTDWCYNDVKYVWQHDIMLGTSDTRFSPSSKMTRAMFVTVLYRLEGSPDITGMQIPAFTDIDIWAHNAIVWAYNVGVTNGKTATTFDPNASITRAEIVAMLYRYAGSPDVSGSLNVFSDASSIGAFAHDAVIWATTLGVVNGYKDGTFGPNRTAQRSEMAAMLHRYMVLTSID